MVICVDHVSAVRTTGIYSLPGCGANPKPENVDEYRSPAAAEEAGFRACLRCRPYHAGPPSYSAGRDLVCRAVPLVLAGALDPRSDQSLGPRLGVSPRHLSRLFQLHLGVTPEQLARSNRAHFARRLLADTDQSVTEIALAAGFGSLRQFNRTCVEVFHAHPTELRIRRRLTDRLVADGGLVLRLAFRPRLNWEVMLKYFDDRVIPGVESVAGGIYRRTILVEGDPGVIELWPGGPDRLLLRVHLPHWQDLIHLAQQARRIFSLDADLESALPHLKSDRALASTTQAGIRIPGTWDPFEVGVSAIMGDRLTQPASANGLGNLVDRYGTRVPGLTALGLSHVFPSPSTLAQADLTEVGLAPGPAATVHALAAATAAGTLCLDGANSLDQLLGTLTALPGLDAGTAQYIALRMGEPDAFPWSDPGIRSRVERVLGKRLAPHQVGQVAERWRPWRAQAAAALELGPRGTSTQRAGARNVVRPQPSLTTDRQPVPVR